MSPEIYLIADNLPGSLFIMPCPSGDHLQRDIAVYSECGVDCVVSMLAIDEAVILGLAQEGPECESLGIDFISSPIPDFGLPDSAIFDALVDQITTRLWDGKNVAVHCRAGIGRSGMVTAGVLVALGREAEQAVDQVAHARGVSIPDTVEQGEFIAKYQARIFGKNI